MPRPRDLGLRNSDDQGTQFDVLAELLRDGAVIASGVERCVTGLTRNPSSARDVVVPFDPPATASPGSGDVLALRVSTRIGTTSTGQKCSGPGGSHASATGLRLYYDSPQRPSRLDATIAPEPGQGSYLRSDGNPCAGAQSARVTTRILDSAVPTAASPKCKDAGPVDFGQGNPWREIGTCIRTVP